MPFLSVRLSDTVSPDVANRMAAQLTELTATILGKKRELTAVAIDAVPAGAWYISGEPIAAQGRASFYLDIKVTEGTNTKNEKAAYVSQVFAAMSSLIGPLASASYVVIHEVRADAWGYEGRTQEFRYIQGRPL